MNVSFILTRHRFLLFASKANTLLSWRMAAFLHHHWSASSIML